MFEHLSLILTKSKAWLCLYLIAQFILITVTYTETATSPLYTTFRSVVGAGLPIAKSSAAALSLSSAIILLPICKNVISHLRNTFIGKILPFDAVIMFHRTIGMSIAIFTVVHVAAHTINLKFITADTGDTPISIMFGNPTFLTGMLLVLVLVLMTTASISKIKRASFEVFIYVHHLYTSFFILLLLHGSFCYVKLDDIQQCAGPQFWKYFIPALVTFAIERVLKEHSIRIPSQIHKVIGHPSQVIELQMKKDNFKMMPGQYVLICIPELAIYQWHSFTMTSAPEEDFLSVHIRCIGDWTQSLAERLGCRWDSKGHVLPMQTAIGNTAKYALPKIMIEGPFGASNDAMFEYSAIACFGAGIGVTPFASILKHIWYRLKITPNMKLKKVSFYWICRDKEAFEWFQGLLAMLESDSQFDRFLDIKIYLTGKLSSDEQHNIILNDGNGVDPLTRLRARTNYGRPNVNGIFSELRKVNRGEEVGVFFCGPKAMDTTLANACVDFSTDGVQFSYNKDNF